MPKRHYTIYCDESAKKGPYYSNFYGGALVQSSDREAIEAILNAKKDELNIFSEMKWSYITKNYQEKYKEFIPAYFEFIHTGRIKVRIMFTHNYHRATNLTVENRDNQYFILYYQMLKHAFGLKYSNPNALDRVFATILLDRVPDTKEKFAQFRKSLAGIPATAMFAGSGVSFPYEQIADVDSKDHAILQGLDIILGSMFFRLNDLHLVKPAGGKRRGKRTTAKEQVYKEINRLIRQIYPNFNIGVSTGMANGMQDCWEHAYRHWRFIPSEYEVNEEAVKPR